MSVACWRAALFLSRSACLLRALTSSLERFLCLRVLTLLRSLRCSSTSIIHQAGEGTTRLGLRQLSTCLRQLSTCYSPGVAPGAESVTDIYIYIYTLAQIRLLHCTISSLALRHSAITPRTYIHVHSITSKYNMYSVNPCSNSDGA